MAEQAGKTKKAAEITEEVVEEAFRSDFVTRLVNNRIINSNTRVPLLVGVTAFAGGAAVGYILGKRRAWNERQEMYGVHEVPETIIEFDGVDLPEEFVIDAEVHKALSQRAELEEVSLVEDDSIETASADPVEEVVSASIFAANDDTWDYEKELASRTLLEPYVIHKDEFFEQENDYTQTTLTYYAGDGILADEQDAPVYNWERVIGELKFGHGSGGDPNVFYIRNDKLRGEYEVLRHDGHYAVEVRGMEPEDEPSPLRHSRFPLTDTN